jgi:hypothetical protein
LGYTTSFKGQFDCYHPENSQLGAFLRAIREGDPTALAVLGDWLSERGDPRGERIAHLVANPSEDWSRFWQLFGLKPEHAAYLKQFSGTRRMRRAAQKLKHCPDPLREAVGLPLGKEGAYFVSGGGWAGQDHDESVLDYNRPPAGQPGLWCQWIPNALGTAIVWNGGEKFYDYVEWLEYLIGHFLAPWGYLLNGEMKWAGEDEVDQGTILVKDNQVTALPDEPGP